MTAVPTLTGHPQPNSSTYTRPFLVDTGRASERPPIERTKRACDLIIATALLLTTLPLLLMSAAMIKIGDGGPVLFRQLRVGAGGRAFSMWKLRTMTCGAESEVIDLRANNARSGPLFKLVSDPRVTKVGRVLRATSIDELPQLWNVLRGEMSLVGPRPALPSEVALFNDELLDRHQVLPGITGLWQILGRDDPDFGLYQRLDLMYVQSRSLAMDLGIMAATARVVTVRSTRFFYSCIRRRTANILG